MSRIARILPEKGILRILDKKMQKEFRVKDIKQEREKPRKEKVKKTEPSSFLPFLWSCRIWPYKKFSYNGLRITTINVKAKGNILTKFLKYNRYLAFWKN